MRKRGLGITGIIVLVVIFLVLAAEDVLIWLRGGELPAVEFLVGTILAVAIVYVAIREARSHPPRRQ